MAVLHTDRGRFSVLGHKHTLQLRLAGHTAKRSSAIPSKSVASDASSRQLRLRAELFPLSIHWVNSSTEANMHPPGNGQLSSC